MSEPTVDASRGQVPSRSLPLEAAMSGRTLDAGAACAAASSATGGGDE